MPVDLSKDTISRLFFQQLKRISVDSARYRPRARYGDVLCRVDEIFVG